jgi:hypothetical protein
MHNSNVAWELVKMLVRYHNILSLCKMKDKLP